MEGGPAEAEAEAEAQAERPHSPTASRTGAAFVRLPSVGSWLQARRGGGAPAAPAAVSSAAVPAPLQLEAAVPAPLQPEAPAAAAASQAPARAPEDAALPAPARSRPRPGFGLKPSVGTWLGIRVEEDSPWHGLHAAKAVEEPVWEADFDAFLSPSDCAQDGAPVIVAPVELSADKRTAAQAPSRLPSGGLFLLTPPPPPSTGCAVQAAARAADVVVIEGLADETLLKPKAEGAKDEQLKPARRSLSTTEELIGTNRAPDDDEEGLLGDDAVGPGSGAFAHRPPGDGVDSASESDMGEQRPVAAAALQPARAADNPRGEEFGLGYVFNQMFASQEGQEQEPPPVPEPPAAVAPRAGAGADAPSERPASASFSPPEKANARGRPGPPPECAVEASKQASTSPAKAAAAAAEVPGPPRDSAPDAPQPSKQAHLPSGGSPPPPPAAAAAAAAAEAPQPSTASSARPAAAWTDVDPSAAKRLDTFFGDRTAWDRVTTQCNSGGAQGGAERPTAESPPPARSSSSRFRVRVPAPHPGLQYRRTKNLGDRHQRYVENNSTVTGQVEDDGAWLRLSHNVFLPMRIDGNQVLEPLAAGSDSPAAAAGGRSGSPNNSGEQLSWLWGWCTGCRDSQAMVDADILVRGDAPRAGMPADVPATYSSR